MKIWHQLTVFFIAVFLLVSCGSNQVRGDGTPVTKTRTVQNFDRIKISGAYKVRITQGSRPSLKITTDSNIIPLIITEVDKNQLSIHNKKGVSFSLTQPVQIDLVVRNLKRISASGANELVVTNFMGNNLKLDTNGSVVAGLSGRVAQLNMEISGSGKIDATNLIAKSVKVRLVGSGEVKVNATDKLDSKITGSGTIFYSGNPGDVEQSIVGTGTLERVK